MKKETLERICEVLDSKLNLYDYSKNYLMDSDIESFDDIRDILLDECALEVEIIYYSNAMQYLANNDASLYRSLEIAEEMGYKISDLNSELLASLLATQDNIDSFNELEEEIQEIIDSEEEEDCDEDESEE